MEHACTGLVDKLQVVVLIENSRAYDTYLAGCFGLSLWLELWRGEECVRVLFDVGPRADTLERNAAALGVPLDRVDAIVLSHCHFDHTAALAGLLERIGRPVTVFGHPDLFRPNFVLSPEFMDYAMNGPNSRSSLESKGARFALSASPSEPYPGLVLTGEVEHRTDFEEHGGVSCFTLDGTGATVPDRLQDDVSAVICVRDVGLVLLSGCGHAGIVNIAKQARKVAGGQEIAAILGGFHLLQAKPERHAQTVQALQELAPSISVIAPMHCTGLQASALMARVFAGAFRELHAGDRITFESRNV